MSWVKGHKTLLDTVSRTVDLDSPANGVVVLQLPPPATKHSSVHLTTAQNMKDIPMAHEFLDCFLMICLTCRQIETWSSPLNYNQAQHISPDGHTR
jgi:hypothetical protein